jgi:NitT/TauT family transport system permease protein
MKISAADVAIAVVTFIVVMGLWEFGVREAGVSMLVLPPPSVIAVNLWDGLVHGTLMKHLGVTFYEILAGFFLGSVIGLLLGGVISQVRILEKIFYPYIVAFQTVPKVAIAPLIIIWLGFGTFSKVVITATIAFFPVLANTIVGLRATPAEQVELLVSMTARPMQVFWKVRVPQALPYVFVGLDVAIVLSVIGAIVGEFVGAQAGLGYMILQRNLSMDLPGVFAILVILSLIGVGLHWVMRLIRRRIVFWVDEGPGSTTGA